MKRTLVFVMLSGLLAGCAGKMTVIGQDIIATGYPATQAKWTQRGSGGYSSLVFRDLTYLAESSESVWDTAPMLVLDPGAADLYYDEFGDFVGNAAAWTITETDAAATEATSQSRPTSLYVANTATDNDGVEIQLLGEGFKLASGKPLWFEARIQCNDATQSDLIVGLCITDTSLITAMSDGVTFRKHDGDANIDFVTEKNSTETSADTGVDLVASTWIKLGFWFNGSGTVTPYVNGVAKTAHTTNICDDEELTVSIAVQNGEGAAKNLSVDYVRVLQVR